MRYIDTHAHYNDEAFCEDREQILLELKNNDIDYVINVGANIEESKKCVELANRYDYIYSTIGVHPYDVEHDNLDELYTIFKNNKKIVAVGEIGLDYYHDNNEDTRNMQINAFKKQIQIAKDLDLPIVVHTRDASLDTYNILKEANLPSQKVLFHCFSPSDELIRLVLKNGYTVAFGGNITYKRNESFKKYIMQIPLSQIVIETDAPYLSPQPNRGKRNTSLNLKYILNSLSQYLQINEEELSKIVYDNSKRFFNIQ